MFTICLVEDEKKLNDLIKTYLEKEYKVIQCFSGTDALNITDKNGSITSFKTVDNSKDLIIITNEGIIIRTLVSDISIVGRNTSGVKLINIDSEKGIRVASIARVKEEMNPEQLEAQLQNENEVVIDDEELPEEETIE